MSKIDLKKFDKLVSDQEKIVAEAEKYSLDANFKQNILDAYKAVDSLIDRSESKKEKEKEDKAPATAVQPAIPAVENAKPAKAKKVEFKGKED